MPLLFGPPLEPRREYEGNDRPQPHDDCACYKGQRQVEGAKKALAHGSTGAAGQFQSVLVLDKE